MYESQCTQVEKRTRSKCCDFEIKNRYRIQKQSKMEKQKHETRKNTKHDIRPYLMGGFWKPKTLPETVFYACFHVFDQEPDRIRLALLRILAVFWREVCRHLFLFFRGVVRGFTILSFSDKIINKAFSDIIYISTFQPNKWHLFQMYRARN